MPYAAERHGPHRIVGPGFHAKVHVLVRTVPAGAVTTYGDLAQALGSKNVARHVGYAMAGLPAGSDVPWWRVVAAAGRITAPGSARAREQAKRLRAEGVVCKGGRVVAFALHRFPLGAS